MNSNGCSVCNEPGHHPSRCPTLSTPLQPGFFKPAGGHRPSEEDEDEKAKNRRKKEKTRVIKP
jgi:hypothetical protein